MLFGVFENHISGSFGRLSGVTSISDASILFTPSLPLTNSSTPVIGKSDLVCLVVHREGDCRRQASTTLAAVFASIVKYPPTGIMSTSVLPIRPNEIAAQGMAQVAKVDAGQTVRLNDVYQIIAPLLPFDSSWKAGTALIFTPCSSYSPCRGFRDTGLLSMSVVVIGMSVGDEHYVCPICYGP